MALAWSRGGFCAGDSGPALPEALAAFPCRDLGLQRSPLEPLTRVRRDAPRIWVKRDDTLGAAGGGNKSRKLEFLLGDAFSQNADVVLTAGAVQSNHARLTAAACARTGISCELFLNRRVPGRSANYEATGNALLDRLLGAHVTMLGFGVDAEAAARARAAELLDNGRRPYEIPVGGSTPIGTLGYVRCAGELLDQAMESGFRVDAIVVAASSGGTLAGLAVGLAAAGWRGLLLGIAVSEPADSTVGRVSALAQATAAVLSRTRVTPFAVDDAFIGPGYGVPTAEALNAIRAVGTLEGLLLDPVYSGKAFAGVIHHAEAGGQLAGLENVVFVHTGGWPALFGYQEELQ